MSTPLPVPDVCACAPEPSIATVKAAMETPCPSFMMRSRTPLDPAGRDVSEITGDDPS
jgi:hypothetical protein